ncbi:MAG: hypothetical protein ACK2U9_20615 [Anaerolineae bacterium]
MAVQRPYRQLSAYFIPLALQAASQSLTYPLVAMVASHGAGGTQDYAGLVQANSLMFLIGTLGYGLVTSGMVFGRTAEGYRRYVFINHAIMVIIALVQALVCIPAVGHAVFGGLLGLPPTIEAPAMQAFPLTIPLNALFLLRNPYQVMLFNHGATGRASSATFLRIGVTLALAPLFCAMGWVGPRMALVCQSSAEAQEWGVSWWFERPFRDRFEIVSAPPPGRKEILWFNLPLAMGGFLMTLGGWLMGGMLARAAEPERMLPAYYLAVGLANPAAYAASQVRAVVIRFKSLGFSDAVTFRFSLLAGTVLAFLPLLFLLPGLSDWYYVGLQRLPAGDLSLVTLASLLLVGFPITVSLRGHREGLAASQRRARTILAGNVTHIASLTVTGWILLTSKVPGNMLAPFAIVASNLASAGVLYYLLRENGGNVPPRTGPAPGIEG